MVLKRKGRMPITKISHVLDEASRVRVHNTIIAIYAQVTAHPSQEHGVHPHPYVFALNQSFLFIY